MRLCCVPLSGFHNLFGHSHSLSTTTGLQGHPLPSNLCYCGYCILVTEKISFIAGFYSECFDLCISDLMCNSMVYTVGDQHYKLVAASHL